MALGVRGVILPRFLVQFREIKAEIQNLLFLVVNLEVVVEEGLLRLDDRSEPAGNLDFNTVFLQFSSLRL